MLGVTKKFLLDKISGFENRHKMLVLEQSTGVFTLAFFMLIRLFLL